MDIYLIKLNTDKTGLELKKLHHKYSKIFLRKILDSFYKITDPIEIDNGKPYLLNGNLNFSVSHSKNIIAIAFDKDKIGMDIE
ncbi:MAG: hypothetical protein LUE64_06360, partial [Candidatus Gastranaerophilales bacterium]|nr:hypothetical protein [Candidatus Gastranaerophilales bacterium]